MRLRRPRYVRRDQLNPNWIAFKRIELMSDDKFMDWVFAGGYKGLDGRVRAFAAVRWCKIRWPDDYPDQHRKEAEAVFNTWDACQPAVQP